MTLEEIAAKLSAALNTMPCRCTREFIYSGVGKIMCMRCMALVEYEKHTTGKSPTEENFKTKKL